MKKFIIITIIVILFLLALAYGTLKLSNSRDFQIFGGLVTKVDTKEKVVALTFDDGPTSHADEILMVLEDEKVKATFFLTGREIKENFSEAEKIAQAGHEIGNHSYSHQRMIFKSPSFVRKEIESTDQWIRKAGYKGPIQFRPPYGKKLIYLPYYLNKHDRKTILWSIEPDSYPEVASDSKKIVEHVNKNIKPGSIILLHVMYDSRDESRKAVRGVIQSLKEKGYTFKTVSELQTDYKDNEESQKLTSHKKDVREVVWNQLTKEQKEETNGRWKDGKISKVTLEKDMMDEVHDKSYEGKEVYRIMFPRDGKSEPSFSVFYADINTFNLIGYALVL